MMVDSEDETSRLHKNTREATKEETLFSDNELK